MNPLNCPDCQGVGYSLAFVDYTDPSLSGPEVLECRRCNSSGKITPEEAARAARGAERRRRRLTREETLHSVARRLGLTAAQVCDLERGLTDPDSFPE